MLQSIEPKGIGSKVLVSLGKGSGLHGQPLYMYTYTHLGAFQATFSQNMIIGHWIFFKWTFDPIQDLVTLLGVQAEHIHSKKTWLSRFFFSKSNNPYGIELVYFLWKDISGIWFPFIHLVFCFAWNLVRRGNQAGRRDGRIEGSPFSERTNSCSGSIWLPWGWGPDAQLKKWANILALFEMCYLNVAGNS